MSKKKKHAKNNQTIRDQGLASISSQFYVKDFFSQNPDEITFVDLSGQQFNITKEQARKLVDENFLLSNRYDELISEINNSNSEKKKQEFPNIKELNKIENPEPIENQHEKNPNTDLNINLMEANEKIIATAKRTSVRLSDSVYSHRNTRTDIGGKKTITDIKITGAENAEVFYSSNQHFKNPIKNIRNWLKNNANEPEKWIDILNVKVAEYKSINKDKVKKTSWTPRVSSNTQPVKLPRSRLVKPINNHIESDQKRSNPSSKKPKAQTNEFEKAIQVALEAVRNSNYESARNSMLRAFDIRRKKLDSKPSSSICETLLNEASHTSDYEMEKTAHLFDMYYELQAMEKFKSHVVDEKIHVWDNIIVDWKNQIAIASLEKEPDEICIPFGVVGISSEFKDTLSAAKRISLPSTFRFYIRDDQHLISANPREFLLNYCGDKPNIQLSGSNRFIKERDGFLFPPSGNEPIMLADNTREEVIFPTGLYAASTDLLLNPREITAMTIPWTITKLQGKDGTTESFFDDFTNLKSFTVKPGNQVYSSSENVVTQKNTVIKIFNNGTELVFPSGTKGCQIPIPAYWQNCNCIEFPGSFSIMEFKRIINELHPHELRLDLDLFRKLSQSNSLSNQGSPSITIFDNYGIIPPEQMSFFFRRRAKLSTGTIVPAIPLKINDIVSVMNTFQCINKGHEMVEVAGLVGYGNGETSPSEMIIRCFFCRNCRKYFMYSSDFNSTVYPYVTSNKYFVFTKFDYNNKLYGTNMYLNASGFAPESLLKQAGYQVNQTVNLSSDQRVSILMFLYDRGVSAHFILSYLNQFISLNGASLSKNMSVAVSRWKKDMQEFKDRVFGP